MSYYYNYYIGYKKDGKIYPLGPYGADKKLHCALSRSRSFASDLHEDFYYINDELMSDELRREFTYNNWKDEPEVAKIKYLPITELPNGSYIKKGYYLIDSIQTYEYECKNNGVPIDVYDLFYDYIPSEIFAQKMQNELAFGKPEPEYDCEGEEIPVNSCRDYAFYAFPDYTSEEYEAFILKEIANIYDYTDLVRGAQIVILETEG